MLFNFYLNLISEPLFKERKMQLLAWSMTIYHVWCPQLLFYCWAKKKSFGESGLLMLQSEKECFIKPFATVYLRLDHCGLRFHGRWYKGNSDWRDLRYFMYYTRSISTISFHSCFHSGIPELNTVHILVAVAVALEGKCIPFVGCVWFAITCESNSRPSLFPASSPLLTARHLYEREFSSCRWCLITLCLGRIGMSLVMNTCTSTSIWFWHALFSYNCRC